MSITLKQRLRPGYIRAGASWLTAFALATTAGCASRSQLGPGWQQSVAKLVHECEFAAPAVFTSSRKLGAVFLLNDGTEVIVSSIDAHERGLKPGDSVILSGVARWNPPRDTSPGPYVAALGPGPGYWTLEPGTIDTSHRVDEFASPRGF